jgi:hypothetical protein
VRNRSTIGATLSNTQNRFHRHNSNLSYLALSELQQPKWVVQPVSKSTSPQHNFPDEKNAALGSGKPQQQRPAQSAYSNHSIPESVFTLSAPFIHGLFVRAPKE